MTKKIIIGLLILALILLPFLPILSGLAFQDVNQENFDTYYLWNRLGIVRGYSDNTLRLKDYVTAAEFATIVNRALELKGYAPIKYQDVNNTDWFYDEVRVAAANGFLTEGEYLYPNEPLTCFTIAPMIYNLYKFKPTTKNYLTEIDNLPKMSTELKDQLNTLINENVLWLSDIKNGVKITREHCLSIIKQLVKEKYVGSLLNMQGNKEDTEIFKLLGLDEKKYYYYDSSNFGDIQSGQSPSSQNNRELGKEIIKRANQCAEQNSEKECLSPVAIWADKQNTHIYYGVVDKDNNYVAYKSFIYKYKNQLLVSTLDSVLFHDRSNDISKEKEEISLAFQEKYEQELEPYNLAAKKLKLFSNDYLIYAPSQRQELLNSKNSPLRNLSTGDFSKVKELVLDLHYSNISGGDLPYAYYVNNGLNELILIGIKYNRYYQVYRISFNEQEKKWQINEISINSRVRRSVVNSELNVLANETNKILNDEKLLTKDFLYTSKSLVNIKLPVILNNYDAILKLDIILKDINTMLDRDNSYAYWVSRDGKVIFASYYSNKNKEINILKFTKTTINDEWMSELIWPTNKKYSFDIPDKYKSKLKEINIIADDYRYIPYSYKLLIYTNQLPELQSSEWNIGNKLVKAIDYCYDIENFSKEDSPAIFVNKDGSEVYTMYFNEEDVVCYVHKPEIVLYNNKKKKVVLPTFSTQQILPKQEYEVFSPPAEYRMTLVKNLRINLFNYTYVPQSEQGKITNRYPSLFKDSCLAGTLAFQKANSLLNNFGSNKSPNEVGCFIHKSGDNVYIVQKKEDNILYVYKLVLERTIEGYIEWNDINEWKFKIE